MNTFSGSDLLLRIFIAWYPVEHIYWVYPVEEHSP